MSIGESVKVSRGMKTGLLDAFQALSVGPVIAVGGVSPLTVSSAPVAAAESNLTATSESLKTGKVASSPVSVAHRRATEDVRLIVQLREMCFVTLNSRLNLVQLCCEFVVLPQIGSGKILSRGVRAEQFGGPGDSRAGRRTNGSGRRLKNGGFRLLSPVRHSRIWRFSAAMR